MEKLSVSQAKRNARAIKHPLNPKLSSKLGKANIDWKAYANEKGEIDNSCILDVTRDIIQPGETWPNAQKRAMYLIQEKQKAKKAKKPTNTKKTTKTKKTK